MKKLQLIEPHEIIELNELPIETQIKVIKNARKNYISHRYNTCLCHNLDYAIRLLFNVNDACTYEYIQNLIPLFTRENARNSVGIDSECMAGYWWAIKNIQKRIEFLDWMISQLENKVNID